MKSSVYHIQSPILQPLVQYILFNHATELDPRHIITSFPNINICLGIVAGQQLCAEQLEKRLKPGQAINAYISGIYDEPHHFLQDGNLDEICIDFTPLGYYYFFNQPLQTYVFENSILTHNFGSSAIPFFESIFQKEQLIDRGQAIEAFLLRHLSCRIDDGRRKLFQSLAQKNGTYSVDNLAKQLHCSARKLQRLFAQYLDITPKSYLRICRLRKLINDLPASVETVNWERLAYSYGFYDYSHLVKEFKLLTGLRPQQFLQGQTVIDQTVIVSQRLA